MKADSRTSWSYIERMARQSPIIGEQGQKKISLTKLTIVGCGGNGSMFAYVAALAGFRKLTLIDPDKLEIHNLNRFVLGGVKDVGKDKTSVIKRSLQRFFPDMEMRTFNADIRLSGTWEQASDCDWLMDNTDNDETRHFLQEKCSEAGIPMISIASGFTLRKDRMLGGCRVNRVSTSDPCLECQILDDQPMEQLPASLVTLNLVAAAMALDILLREITGYTSVQDSMPSSDNSQYSPHRHNNDVNFILFDLINRTMITERIVPSLQCSRCGETKTAYEQKL